MRQRNIFHKVCEQTKKYDLSFLKRISDNDSSFLIEMIQAFRSTAPGVIKRMQDYISQERFEALSREAHKFIPGISFLGAKYLESDLSKIEEYAKNGINLDQIPELYLSVKEKIETLIQVLIDDFNLK